jgi:hypothetical protein
VADSISKNTPLNHKIRRNRGSSISSSHWDEVEFVSMSYTDKWQRYFKAKRIFNIIFGMLILTFLVALTPTIINLFLPNYIVIDISTFTAVIQIALAILLVILGYLKVLFFSKRLHIRRK